MADVHKIIIRIVRDVFNLVNLSQPRGRTVSRLMQSV